MQVTFQWQRKKTQRLASGRKESHRRGSTGQATSRKEAQKLGCLAFHCISFHRLCFRVVDRNYLVLILVIHPQISNTKSALASRAGCDACRSRDTLLLPKTSTLKLSSMWEACQNFLVSIWVSVTREQKTHNRERETQDTNKR